MAKSTRAPRKTQETAPPPSPLDALRAEIQAALDVLNRVAPSTSPDALASVEVLREKMKARLSVLRHAPASATWEWLAERGDTGAAAVVLATRGKR